MVHDSADPAVLVELVRPDGTVLRHQVPRHQVDKMLAQALHDGLSVRRVQPCLVLTVPFGAVAVLAYLGVSRRRS